ncbi:MAG: DNA repair exonuclease [Alphaproteobacteria bacterium]|nr:DNA repair exonuclease [Alphaproteobacteria bacterium]
MAYRFIHSADIHLDSPLRSLAMRDPSLSDLISNATRQAFVCIIDLCLEERVDALLLAGDLYDGGQTSMKTARFLAEQIRRLDEAGIRSFIIRGNHDALSKITKELVFPESVKVFGGRAEAIEIARSKTDCPVFIHGLSFAEPQAPDSLLGKYRPPVEGAINIGLLHTSLDGAAGHDPYSPCKLADLMASGFTYWALGHIHKRRVESGRCTIVMPGMPQGRDINEAGPKSVTLVTIGDDRSVHIEERLTNLAQFERLTVDVSSINDWAALVKELCGVLKEKRRTVPSEQLVARLRLTGKTPLAWRIRRDPDLLMEELDKRARGMGRCWVEKLEIDCQAPGRQMTSPGDPLIELHRLIEEEVIPSAGFRTETGKIVEELLKQLPREPECRNLFGANEAAFEVAIQRLAMDGAQDVLARLHVAGEGEKG